MNPVRGRAWVVIVGLLVTACSTSPSAGPASPSPSARASASPAASQDASPEATASTPEPSGTGSALVPEDALLPNLVMEPLSEWTIEYEGARRLLHVTTIFSNYGEGAFELRGGRAANEPVIDLDQVIYTETGGFRRVPTRVDARYAGDGHNHWHAQQVVTMELANVLDPADITNGNKIHFCFFDNTKTNTELPGFDESPYYKNRWCGTPDSYAVRMGLSIGYGDRYGWDFVGQYIDISALPGGTYTLKATVDWANNLYETDDTDNCTMARVQIPATGSGSIVVVEAGELDCQS
jgi:hypothetical protein